MAGPSQSNKGCKFCKGEKVFCCQPGSPRQKMPFEAESNDPTWDGLMTEEHTNKDNPESRKRQRELADEFLTRHGVQGDRSWPGMWPGGLLTGQGNKPLSPEVEDFRPEDILPLSAKFKTMLEIDYELIAYRNKVYKVPAKTSALDILEMYLKDFGKALLNEGACGKRKRNPSDFDVVSYSNKMNLCREVVDGLRIYLDFLLDTTLLYLEEFGQFEAIKEAYGIDKQKEEPAEGTWRVPEYLNYSNVTKNMEKLSFNGATTSEPRPEPRINEGASCSNGRKSSLKSGCGRADSKGKSTAGPPNYRGTGTGYIPDVKELLQAKLTAWTLVPPDNGTENRLLSSFYGAPHLARAYVKLPEILVRSTHSEEKNALLISYLNDTMEYLENHPEWFAEENYEENTYPVPEWAVQEDSEEAASN